MSQEAEWGSPDKSRWQELSEQSAREKRRAAQTESSGGLWRVPLQAPAENLVYATKNTTQKSGKEQFKRTRGNSLQSPHGTKNSLCSHQAEWKNLVMHQKFGYSEGYLSPL